ncbi:MAG: S-formylglutathione hydrolase [Alphaproteobacteria bacterium]
MSSVIKCNKFVRVHGGSLGYYSHESENTKTSMNFTVFTPPEDKKCIGYVVFLSGLTCTEDNFTTKAGAYDVASSLGLAVLAPDTSPRGEGVADDDAYDLGQGAGFYINATQEPWADNFQMESYLIEELLPICEKELSLPSNNKAIMGHSMGGHGALTLYFKYPDMFCSCSAFSPIVAPSIVPWGQKAFSNYLGDDRLIWSNHDACELVRRAHNPKDNPEILIDQGMADNFLVEQLRPEMFEQACAEVGQKLKLRLHDGYDHSYFFIQSFIADHLAWHANKMN